MYCTECGEKVEQELFEPLPTDKTVHHIKIVLMATDKETGQ